MKQLSHHMTVKRTIVTTLLFIAFFLIVPKAEAKPLDFNGGVHNEYAYEEVFFLTGNPIKFTGKVTVTERESKNKITTTYQYTLTNPLDYKLTRRVSYETNLNEHTDKGQTTSETKVKSYSEKVTIGKDLTYTLDDYQLSQSTIIDNRPASDFYSGNVVGRKMYKTNTDELVTVNFSGRNMGYENFWGSTETQLIDYEIVSNKGQAFITSKVSDSKSKTLHYEPHDPSLSSFIGGHIVVTTSGMIGEYTYDIPYGSGNGTIGLSQDNVPIIQRLIVPKFRDVSGHWAQEDIEKLYSLGVFDEVTSFFSPNTPMNRYQFITGVLKGVDLRVLEEPKKQKTPRKGIFKDLDPKAPDYLYIESAVRKGITYGVTQDLFMPDSPITRAQAVTTLVRALGMEGRAPSPGYKTSFVDDSQIQGWAKDSVYVAAELGLVYGDQNNYFNPNDLLTRAQSAAILVRFLNFLENDLKQNYRDDILFFN